MDPFLRDELAAIIVEELSAQPKVLEMTTTGEVLSREAMNMARAYDAATVAQRRALDAVRESWPMPTD